MHSKTPWTLDDTQESLRDCDGKQIALFDYGPDYGDEQYEYFARLSKHSVNAIAALAEHLGVDAGELAERLAKNDVLTALARLAKEVDEGGWVLPRTVSAETRAALRLLRGKEE